MTSNNEEHHKSCTDVYYYPAVAQEEHAKCSSAPFLKVWVKRSPENVNLLKSHQPKLGQRLLISGLQKQKSFLFPKHYSQKKKYSLSGRLWENDGVDASADNAEWFKYFHLQEHQSGALQTIQGGNAFLITASHWSALTAKRIRAHLQAAGAANWCLTVLQLEPCTSCDWVPRMWQVCEWSVVDLDSKRGGKQNGDGGCAESTREPRGGLVHPTAPGFEMPSFQCGAGTPWPVPQEGVQVHIPSCSASLPAEVPHYADQKRQKPHNVT